MALHLKSRFNNIPDPMPVCRSLNASEAKTTKVSDVSSFRLFSEIGTFLSIPPPFPVNSSPSPFLAEAADVYCGSVKKAN